MPHIGYNTEWDDLDEGRIQRELVVCLGLVDQESGQSWMFEATPDMPQQLYLLKKEFKDENGAFEGIFLTHAHMGHYTGLMHFGIEAMGADGIPVYAMPRMKTFLENNGPWSQLVNYKNIELRGMKHDSTIHVNSEIKVTPFLVPHRDEYSETVGFKIESAEKSALFIPDINKWELWERSIVEEVKKVDHAFLDATFFQDGEIPRPISEVPHPFIMETAQLFSGEDESIKSKIIFIHFNHTNPALKANYKRMDSLKSLGFRFARQGDIIPF